MKDFQAVGANIKHSKFIHFLLFLCWPFLPSKTTDAIESGFFLSFFLYVDSPVCSMPRDLQFFYDTLKHTKIRILTGSGSKKLVFIQFTRRVLPKKSLVWSPVCFLRFLDRDRSKRLTFSLLTNVRCLHPLFLIGYRPSSMLPYLVKLLLPIKNTYLPYSTKQVVLRSVKN